MSTTRVSHLSDPRQIATSLNIARRKTDPLDLSSDQTTVTVDRPMSVAGGFTSTADAGAVNFNASGVYKVATVQVVGPRQTGWVADTGTALKTANATYTAGTTLAYSATYVQSEQTATGTRLAAVELALQKATQELKALKDALLTHGLIGT